MKVQVDKTGEVIDIPDSAAGEFAAKGGYSFPEDAAIPVKHDDGTVSAVPVQQYLQQAALYRPASQGDVQAHLAEQQKQQAAQRDAVLQAQYGEGIANTVRAGAEGVARGATFGASDWVQTQLGVDATGLREREQRNPIAAATGELIGTIAPLVLTGGESAIVSGAARMTPVAIADVIGTAVGKRVTEQLGEGFAARLAAGSANMAVQGALAGVGGEVSDRAVNGKALLDEGTMSEYLMAAGTGGLVGGALGGAGHLALEGVGAGLRLGGKAVELGKSIGSKAIDALNAPGVEADAAVRAAEQRLRALKPEDLSPAESAASAARAKVEAAAPKGEVLPGAMGERADAPLEAVGRKVKEEAAALGVPQEAADHAWQRIENGRDAYATINQERDGSIRRIAAAGDELQQLNEKILDQMDMQRRNTTLREALATDRTAAPPEQFVGAMRDQFSQIREMLRGFENDPESQVKSWAQKLGKHLDKSATELDSLGRTETVRVEDAGGDFVYHSAPLEAAPSIQKEGLQVRRTRAGPGALVKNPDLEDDILYVDRHREAVGWNKFMTLDAAQPAVMLRTARPADTAADIGTNLVSRTPRSPEHLEFFDPETRAWAPLKDFSPERFKRAVTSGAPTTPALNDRAGTFLPTGKMTQRFTSTTDAARSDAFEILDQTNRLLGRVRDKIGDRSNLGIATFPDALSGLYEDTRQLLKNPMVVGEKTAAISGQAKTRWSDFFDVSGGYRRELLAQDAGGARTTSGFDTVDRWHPAKIGALLDKANTAEGQLSLELVGRGLDTKSKLFAHFAEDLGAEGETAAMIKRHATLTQQIADDVVHYRSKAALADEYVRNVAPALKEMEASEAKLTGLRERAQIKFEKEQARAEIALEKAQTRATEVKASNAQATILDGALSSLGFAAGGIGGMIGAHTFARLASSMAAPVMRQLATTGLQSALRTGQVMQQLERVATVGRRLNKATAAIGDALRAGKPLQGAANVGIEHMQRRDVQAEYDKAVADVTRLAPTDARAAYLTTVMPPQRQRLQMRPDLDKTPTVMALEQRKFLRQVQAVTDPVSVVEAFSQGRGTAEGAGALRTVYPALFARSMTGITQHAAALTKAPSMGAQRHLSLLAGQPLHFTSAPEYVQFTQTAYQDTGAPAAGSQASASPRARNVQMKTTASLATPGQRLEGGVGAR